MDKIKFTFSDLLAGYVKGFDREADVFTLETAAGHEVETKLTSTVYAELVRNLNEAYHDATPQIRDMLTPGRYLFVWGIYYPEETALFEAKHIVFVGRTKEEYRFESHTWWTNQIKQLADFYLESEFGDGEIDYGNYRTNLTISGQKQSSGRQETDTISRLVYGFASAYMLTGEEDYLEAAERGTEYLREHMRFYDSREGICYWYHAIDLKEDGSEQKVFASEFGDDYYAIPCYEQIYALAGPVQTYRATGDPAILDDVDATVRLFRRYFRDHSPAGGFYTHIDPITFSPHAESLGKNRARKNWNSVGDHAPAFLINLWLATGDDAYKKFLEHAFDTIIAHFPDFEESPFVQERFHEDWSKDQSWGWQQNRAVVGHNLKIAWNLTRMYNLQSKEEYIRLAKKLADIMPAVGSDQRRGGWYDVLERALGPTEKVHRFVWHDRKAWWQQEQAILAYLILTGVLDDSTYRRHAREAAAFYNTWFLDVDAGGVYFNVQANGLPYALGTERGKGSHSMAGYHAFELCYLAAVYTNLLITKEPLDLYFKPKPGAFKDNLLRVAPDLLPRGSVRIAGVWINGQAYSDFDSEQLWVRLPTSLPEMRVRVCLEPANVVLVADLVELTDEVASIVLIGSLSHNGIKYLKEQLDHALDRGVHRVEFMSAKLEDISSEAIRYLVFTKQKTGPHLNLTFVNTKESVKQAIVQSGFGEEITIAEETD